MLDNSRFRSAGAAGGLSAGFRGSGPGSGAGVRADLGREAQAGEGGNRQGGGDGGRSLRGVPPGPVAHLRRGEEMAGVCERRAAGHPSPEIPGLLARAYNQLGLANVMLNTPDSLVRAEEALRKGADAGGAWGAMARYNLAELLYRQRSWAEAAEAAQRYLQEAGPEGTSLKEARMLLCRTRNLQPDPPDPGMNPEPIRIGGEVKRPEILFQTKPEYTQEARRGLAGGTVIIETIIDDAGCVRSLRVLQGLSHGLTESALNAVRQWVFTPATLEGKPVKVYYVLTVNYSVSAGAGR